MHKIFWVSLSAAILAARLSGAAETTYGADIDQIEELVEKGNWVELRGFLRDRPDLTDGTDPFSRELSNFLGQTSSLYSALIIDQVRFPDVKNARIAAAQASLPTPLGKPVAKDSDLLLEAELAALKGSPEFETKTEIFRGEGDDDLDPLRKKTAAGLATPQNPDDNIEIASLDLDVGESAFDVSDAEDVAALDDIDRAVTSARDAPAGPSIY